MLNLLESPRLNKTPYVVGGNNTPTLRKWLSSIGAIDYCHLQLDIISIDPVEIDKSAIDLAGFLATSWIIFSVGSFADKVLSRAGLPHGVLPSPQTKDETKIQISLREARNYFLGRI